MWKFATVATSFVLAMASTAIGAPVDGQTRTLVVVDRAVDQDSYATVFDQLKQREHDLEIKNVKEDEFALMRYGDLNYDNVLVLPTVKTRTLGDKLTSAKLLEYFNNGGNIVAVTGASSVPESLREFAAELDVHVSPKGYKLVDHFASLVEAGGDGENKHDGFQVKNEQYVGPKSIVDDKLNAKISQCSAAYLGNSELVVPLVRAPSTSYAYDSRDEDEVIKTPWVTGSQGHLAAAVQANNNARFLWLGCESLLKASPQFTQWAFQERSVIRSRYFGHHLQGSQELNERLYKVNEPMHYEIGLSEWDGQAWKPYTANDVQLEFTMLDPYYRLTMNKTETLPDQAVYSADFDLPDQYGMFTFRVSYRREGLSFIDETDVVTVRHIANDEWPRSWEITNSWVYMASAGSVVVAWLAFMLVYLYSPSDVSVQKKTQ